MQPTSRANKNLTIKYPTALGCTFIGLVAYSVINNHILI